MKYKRRAKRKGPAKYRCCSQKMTYKESYGLYVCEICGRTKEGAE